MVKMGAKQVQSEDDIQGNARPLPGRYHAIVKDVKYQCREAEGKKWVEVDEAESDNAERIKFTFEVLAGTCPGQEGREVEDDFYLSEKAIARLQRIAICANLLQPGEEEKEVQFSDAVGRQLVIEVDEEEYKDNNGVDRKKIKLSFLGMWSLNNKAVSDVPKNMDAIKLMEEVGGGGGNGGGGTTQASQKPAATAAATAASGSGDKWADL